MGIRDKMGTHRANTTLFSEIVDFLLMASGCIKCTFFWCRLQHLGMHHGRELHIGHASPWEKSARL